MANITLDYLHRFLSLADIAKEKSNTDEYIISRMITLADMYRRGVENPIREELDGRTNPTSKLA